MISISSSPLYLTQYTQLHPTFLKEFPLKKKPWRLFLFNKSNHHSLLFLYKRKIIITHARTVNNTRDSSIFIHKKKDIMGECQMFRIGPLPGDLAEIEAFCRIFRASEQLHTAVMDTLCDPKTGECTVSYNDKRDNNVAGDVPVLEEKVVSALACMSSFLQRAKQEVLAGRAAVQSLTDHADTDWHDDKLPPLATFRAEMKNCSYMLENALGSYFSSTDEQCKYIWRRLQRLKNVLYDAGFARSEGSPCHTLLPNWSAVRLFPIKSESDSHDNEVCFWRGGQVTEEGLKWLMEKGYKTIVDLRAERDEDNWSLTARQEAVKLGNIRVVHIPVEVGNAPTRKQVEEFTSLLDQTENMPLYLHSQEGVSRMSAMVSRWREFAIRNNATPCASRISKINGLSTSNTQDRDGASKISQDFLYAGMDGGPESSSSKNESFLKAQEDHEVQETFDGVNGKNREGVESTINTDMLGGNSFCNLTPFEAQRLQCDIFSKREVSQLFKKRSISPKSFGTGTSKKPKTYPIRTDSADRKYSGNAADKLVTTVPSPFSSAKGRDSKKEEVLDSPDSTKYIFSKGDGKARNPTDGILERRENRNKEPAYLMKPGKNDNNDVTSPSSSSQERSGDRSPVNSNASADSPRAEKIRDMDPVSGNMCASTTGIVRLQSRKKAEMYLVRTDGVSCAREKVKESSLAFTHPSTQQQMLMWKTPPKTVLLLKKLGDELLEEAKQVASFLHHQENMDVLVEPEVHSRLSRVTGFGFTKTFNKEDLCDLHERVDFVACLGGDGVILHASNLFSQAVPPIVSFNLGSLGFLTAHNFRDFEKDLKAIIHGNNRHDGVYITLRMRLRCEIIRKNNQVAQTVSTILNEVVVNRGSNPYICKIECYERDILITKVQADGIIVATPTGSTAYSTSAGGSMVHPNVPCMLFTPICPHSLSFRPVILPDSAQLLLKVPEDARSEAYVSFDGKQRQELYKGDAVRICMSEHPLPTVNKSNQTDDWFRSLVRCLNWNDRVEQKSL